jgi:hypothetical protein
VGSREDYGSDFRSGAFATLFASGGTAPLVEANYARRPSFEA